MSSAEFLYDRPENRGEYDADPDRGGSGWRNTAGGGLQLRGPGGPSVAVPWLTAERNVELALAGRGVPKAQRRRRAAELLEAVHLREFAGKRPHQLSGGMRQRVALARALAQDAQLLLMDEPFGALDAMTRDLLHDELERIWRDQQLSVLFVTHNVREAVRLGDRVVVLSSRPGRVTEQYQVPRTGPRRIKSFDAAELAGAITQRLREEVSRHGAARHG
jgi:NitT/TauT family transport system ATP-binding protein